MPGNSHNPPADHPGNGATVDDLSPWQESIIDLFVHAVQALGLPKSIGQIYGLLYGFENPVTMDQVCQYLSISMGSASQGLRQLRQLGAVKSVFVVGQRREHFVAERSLRRFGAGFISEILEPHVDSGKARLEHLQALLEDLPETEHAVARDRYESLKNWHAKASKLLPVIRNFL